MARQRGEEEGCGEHKIAVEVAVGECHVIEVKETGFGENDGVGAGVCKGSITHRMSLGRLGRCGKGRSPPRCCKGQREIHLHRV